VLLTDRVRDVLSALARLRSGIKSVRKALVQRIGDGYRDRNRIRYQMPWQNGFAVGSGGDV
jgi:hypothetical protein